VYRSANFFGNKRLHGVFFTSRRPPTYDAQTLENPVVVSIQRQDRSIESIETNTFRNLRTDLW